MHGGSRRDGAAIFFVVSWMEGSPISLGRGKCSCHLSCRTRGKNFSPFGWQLDIYFLYIKIANFPLQCYRQACTVEDFSGAVEIYARGIKGSSLGGVQTTITKVISQFI